MSRRVSILGLFAALALAVSCGSHRIRQEIAPAFANLELANMAEIKNKSDQVLLSGKFATTQETSGEVERKALLTNPANKNWKGEVKLEIERENGEMTSDEIELTLEGLPKETPCAFLIDNVEVTNFMTSKDGKADMKLSRKALAQRD